MVDENAGERGAHRGAVPADRFHHSEHGSGPRKDHFLQLVFFEAPHAGGDSPHVTSVPRPSGSYAPLRNTRGKAGDRYRLPLPGAPEPLRLDSPALEVMTDLHRVSAVTTDRNASIANANQTMIARGVRALFVVDDTRRMLGILTSSDLLGERPIQLAHARGVHYDEVAVRDIMTPAERLEVVDLRDVQRAQVGNIVATLRLASRQHALVVEDVEGGAAGDRTVCGIFSLTQIGRRLGIPPQQAHDIARTFAEIEALIASG